MLEEIRALAKLLRIQHGVFPLEMLKQAADALDAMLPVVVAADMCLKTCIDGYPAPEAIYDLLYALDGLLAQGAKAARGEDQLRRYRLDRAAYDKSRKGAKSKEPK